MPRNKSKLWKNPVRTLMVIWGAVSLVISMMGPFGSFPVLNFAERLVYWGAVIAMAIVLVGIMRGLVIKLLGKGLHPFQLDAILLPAFVLVFTPPLHFFTAEAAGPSQPFSLFETGLIVLGVSLMLIALREILHLHAPGTAVGDAQADTPHSLSDAALSEVPDPETPPYPALFDRLPEDLHGPLWAISGSNYHVEVRTVLGQTSVLLRFSDALREIDGVPGQRVHRSHWVADAAASHLRRAGNRQFVVLHSGCELPVSQTYADQAIQRWGTPRS